MALKPGAELSSSTFPIISQYIRAPPLPTPTRTHGGTAPMHTAARPRPTTCKSDEESGGPGPAERTGISPSQAAILARSFRNYIHAARAKKMSMQEGDGRDSPLHRPYTSPAVTGGRATLDGTPPPLPCLPTAARIDTLPSEQQLQSYARPTKQEMTAAVQDQIFKYKREAFGYSRCRSGIRGASPQEDAPGRVNVKAMHARYRLYRARSSHSATGPAKNGGLPRTAASAQTHRSLPEHGPLVHGGAKRPWTSHPSHAVASEQVYVSGKKTTIYRHENGSLQSHQSAEDSLPGGFTFMIKLKRALSEGKDAIQHVTGPELLCAPPSSPLPVEAPPRGLSSFIVMDAFPTRKLKLKHMKSVKEPRC